MWPRGRPEPGVPGYGRCRSRTTVAAQRASVERRRGGGPRREWQSTSARDRGVAVKRRFLCAPVPPTGAHEGYRRFARDGHRGEIGRQRKFRTSGLLRLRRGLRQEVPYKASATGPDALIGQRTGRASGDALDGRILAREGRQKVRRDVALALRRCVCGRTLPGTACGRAVGGSRGTCSRWPRKEKASPPCPPFLAGCTSASKGGWAPTRTTPCGSSARRRRASCRERGDSFLRAVCVCLSDC